MIIASRTVCLDETHTQLRGDVRDPLPGAPGPVACHDPEDVRAEVATRLLIGAPVRGGRGCPLDRISVTARRTGVDGAHCVQALVDVSYPDDEKIVLVMDHLNTHTVASLDEAFPPAAAKRIADRLAIDHTPKHGSWLTMAAIAFSVLGRHGLDRRSGDAPTVMRAVAAGAGARNAAARRIDWRFTPADARITRKHRSPITLRDD